MYLIAGLGNIGSEYEGTRHNIGFEVVDLLVSKHGGTFAIRPAGKQSQKYLIGVKSLTCIKPTTYMNLSGKAVQYWLEKKKIPLERLLVITDDIALPLSQIAFKGEWDRCGS